jgi:endoglucanase
VDKNGVVTGMHKAGDATITAKAGDATLTCKVTNSIIVQDISAMELVSKIKIGTNFSAMDNIDFYYKYGYDDYENSSSRIFIDFALYEPGKNGEYVGRGINMRKGDTVHQVIPLDSLEDCDPSLTLSRAVIGAFYHGSGDFDGKMTISVSNAKITVGNKVYMLDYLNGTNTMTMKAEFNKDYNCWSCGSSIGNAVDSGLPKVADLKSGTFEADITIVDISESNRPDKVTYYLTNEEMAKAPTKEMIDALKDAGYDAVRLTVSYTPFMNNDTFIIDKSWLDKVEETVNWILSNNMYCIIDTHSDYLSTSWVGDHWSGAWMLPKYQTYVDERFSMMWKQIADRFKDYDDYLLFESMNEPGMSYEADIYESYVSEGGNPNDFTTMQADRINALNNAFFSIVQDSGGNNPNRFLVFPCINEIYGYLDYLEMPESDKIIASVHSYFFTHDNGKYSDTFDGEQAGFESVIQKNILGIAAFIEKTGVPVIIGEFGNTEELENSARIYQASYLVEKAKEIGVPCFWWECGVDKNKEAGERFGLYDRNSMSWVHEDILQAIMKAAKKQ